MKFLGVAADLAIALLLVMAVPVALVAIGMPIVLVVRLLIEIGGRVASR